MIYWNPSNLTSQARRVYQSALILAGIHIAFSVILLVATLVVRIPEMVATTIFISLIAIASIAAAVLSRRGKELLGIWLIIGAIALCVPAISLFTSGLGWLSVIEIPFVIFLTTAKTIPPNQRPWVIWGSLLAGIAALVIDIFGPQTRRAFPNAEIIVPIIVGVIILLTVIITIRQFANYALNTRLLIFFLMIAVLPLASLAFLYNRNTTNTLLDAAYQNLSTTAILTAKEIDTVIQNHLETLKLESQLTAISAVLEASPEDFAMARVASLDTLLLLQRKDTINIISYTILDTDGEIVSNYPFGSERESPYLGLHSSIVNEMLDQIQNGETYVSPVIFDQNEDASLYFASPIYTGVYTGQLDPGGMLVMRLQASVLQSILENSVGVAGADSFGILLDENNQYLAHGTSPETLYKTVDTLPENQVNTLQSKNRLLNLSPEALSSNLSDFSQHLENFENEKTFTIDDIGTAEGRYLVAVQPLNSQPWLTAFFQPQEILSSQIEQQNQSALILVLVIVTVVTGLSIGISRLLATPIIKLTALVQRITEGDLTIQVPVVTEDEIGSLGEAFNTMTSQLRETLESLEERVAERTQELEERTAYLEASGEISQAAATILDPDALIQQVVDLIKNRLDLYYVGLFLVDENNEWAVLQAGTGEAGRAMLAENHRLKVGEGMIGWCIANDQARIALDVGEDAVRFENPFLPETRSEGALPLRSRNRVIGALSVQSSKPAAFDHEIITVFQTMADQVAIALDNAELFARGEQALEAERRAYGELSREAWKELLSTQADLSILSTVEQPIRTPQGNWTTAMKAAAESGEISHGDDRSLAIPIILRDQILGVVRLKKQPQAPPWSDREIELMDSLVDQLEIALESARLFSDTQKQFVRERMVSEMTTKMRETLNIDTILQSTVREIRDVLDLSEAEVWLSANETEES